ncbi:unnamed protein product [Parnassius mnemosyne]|uniref:MD-2-related lipid-recognition domain-containing protein n=1 Tax=Parnassius mnemosyne TaxID=213953 RepID=A0AAV1L6B6_9NEOP
MYAIVSLCALVTIVAGQTTSVSRCKNYPGELPLHTYVEGCNTPPCQLPQLQDAVINLVFKSSRVMPSMTTLATAYLGFGIFEVPVPYDLGTNAITCNFLTNTYCPVLQDEVVTYTLKMYIESFFPVVTVTIEFRVVDHNEEPVLCIRMPVTIVSPVETPDQKSNATLFINDGQ